MVLLSAVLSLGGAAAPVPGPSSALCGTTITTDTVLSSDLVCSGNGITFGADGITLFLNGHSITGPSRGPPVRGITVLGRSDVRIEGHGSIANFRTGILIGNSQGVEVSKVAVLDNGLTGFADADGIRVLASTDVLIEKSLLSGNGNDGIQVVGSSAVVVEKSVLYNNTNGVALGSVGNAVTKNLMAANKCGIKGSTDGNTVKKNSFWKNDADLCA